MGFSERAWRSRFPVVVTELYYQLAASWGGVIHGELSREQGVHWRNLLYGALSAPMRFAWRRSPGQRGCWLCGSGRVVKGGR